MEVSLGISEEKVKILWDIVAIDLWPECKKLGDLLNLIAKNENMTDAEKVYCTFQVTRQTYLSNKTGKRTPDWFNLK